MLNTPKCGPGMKINLFTDAEREMFATMKVAILSPIMHIEPQWARSTVNAVAFAWHWGLRVEDMGITERVVVDWARNELVRAVKDLISVFDDQPFTHYMWLDADHIFDRDLICQLARHFAFPEIDMVSALYFNRTEPHLPVVYVKDAGPSVYTHYPLVEVPNCLCEVDAVGFGAVMTKRECFEKVPDPWFTLDYQAGEDMAFCVHAKKAGVRIFLDGQYKLGHFASKKIVTEKTYKDYVEAHPGIFGDKVQVKLGGLI